MDTLLFTLAFFGAAILVMSVGVLFKRKPIQGSCGGIANFMGDCDICELKSDCVDKEKHEKLVDRCTPIDCAKES